MYKNNMYKIRRNKGLTQQQVADKIGITRSYYAMIENEARECNVKIALKFSKIFNVKVEEVYTLIQDEK